MRKPSMVLQYCIKATEMLTNSTQFKMHYFILLKLIILMCMEISIFSAYSVESNANIGFLCKSGGLLNVDRVCDGHLDCYDGSDEIKELCYRTICPEGHYRCHYGACIPKSKKCNGIRDCSDGSDEIQCGRKVHSCGHNEFLCKTVSKCIPQSAVCDGTVDCADGSDESSMICDQELCPLGTFKCKYGGCIQLSGQCDGFNDCIDGSDETPTICLAIQCPKCRKSIKCPPIKSSRISAVCTINEQEVPCDEPMEPGTYVKFECKEFYKPATIKDENNDQSVCQLDGNWSRDILKCVPECGAIGSAIPLVMNGWNALAPFPWHVNLYMRTKIEYKFWCGGTLISEAVVVTAAHCVWNVKKNDLKLSMGSTSSLFNDPKSVYTKMLSVKRIVIHPLYQDKFGSYGSDIALIEMDGNVELSSFFLPVCIDWNLDDITSHLSHTSLGLVAGMGVSEDNSFSDRLKVTTLPVVGDEECMQKQQPDFKKYLTFTTFCAGWENGTGVCNGDSGSGLIFPTKDLWYLQGVVSLSPRRASTSLCDTSQFTIFTKVGMYVSWIRNVLAEVHSHHNFTSKCT
ncbi:Modular serine protease [Pseudolycoriella hygida]|uniref:Modular serine protease n=1 Tax=Pseudolycoriella hygida TaxID=35572 RepID=A0A9Q0RUP9_9DIPT|nr:Modular serine protease [Pseudolycoriella hygida]